MEDLLGDGRSDGGDAIRYGEITDIYSFLKHVDWQEPWIQMLLGFHVLCFVVIVATRRYTNIQAVLFILLLGIIFFAEQLNQYAAVNYRKFSRLQYFDASGLFISLVLCVPVLFNCFVMLICWLYIAGSMLIKVKRKQLIAKSRSQVNAGDSTSDGTNKAEGDKQVTEAASEEKKDR